MKKVKGLNPSPWARLRRDGTAPRLCPYRFFTGSTAPSQSPETYVLGLLGTLRGGVSARVKGCLSHW